MSSGFGRMRVTDGGTTVSSPVVDDDVDFENGADGFWNAEI